MAASKEPDPASPKKKRKKRREISPADVAEILNRRLRKAPPDLQKVIANDLGRSPSQVCEIVSAFRRPKDFPWLARRFSREFLAFRDPGAPLPSLT
jgi:hypothetical protein